MGNPSTASEHPSSGQYSATPTSHRHLDGVAAIFSTPPVMGHPSTMHKHLQSPHDAQTSALHQTPHAVDAIPKLTPSGASSLPHPIKDVPSVLVQQLLQEQEARWSQRYQDQARKNQDDYCLQLLEYQKKLFRCSDKWYERCEKKNQEITEQSVEIVHLIVESLLPIFLLILTDI